MTNRNSTEFALDALPLLCNPPMDFDCLYHIRCPLLQPLMISPPSSWTAYGPEGDLFQYPLQIIPLALEHDHVKLGLYAHPALKLFKGPAPGDKWLEAWKDAPFNPHHESSFLPFQSTLGAPADLYDGLCNLVELHHFLYDTVNALTMEANAIDLSPTTSVGLWRFSRWLREQEETLKQRVNVLCKQDRLEHSLERKETLATEYDKEVKEQELL